MSSRLLDVEELKIYYGTQRGDVKAVDGISFSVKKGQAFGLAGESGCGKTTAALAITRLLPHNGKTIGGKIIFDGLDVLKLDEDILRKNIRWKRVSLIFQGAMNALNPVLKVGDQIVEALMLHEDVSRKEAWNRVEELFRLVGMDPSRAYHYPHEFSGGMKQRAMIAMALTCNPDLVIADEPSTALDVIVVAQILALIKRLREELGLSMILITHDLSIIAETCNEVAIMYAGKIVESADTVTVFKNPLHPYTQGLIASFPSLRASRETKLPSIPGTPPNLLNPPSGCRFYPRCPHTSPICKEEEPKTQQLGESHFVACYKSAGLI